VLKRGGNGDRETNELVPTQPGFTIAIDDLLSAAECAALIGAANESGWRGATPADRAPKKNEAYLDRDRVDFGSAPFEAELWHRLQPHLPLVDTPVGRRAPVGLHSDGRRGEPGQCRVYRYVAGHRFGRHVDVSRRCDRSECAAAALGEPPSRAHRSVQVQPIGACATASACARVGGGICGGRQLRRD
jgi:hypothetical protein